MLLAVPAEHRNARLWIGEQDNLGRINHRTIIGIGMTCEFQELLIILDNKATLIETT